jgi:putative sterol carrier protein
MEISKAEDFFDLLVREGRHPRFSADEGVWEFQLEGADTWTVAVKAGEFKVTKGPAKNPTTRLKLTESELVRIARGDGHENFLTALLRGALKLEGDFRFAQKLQTVLPLPDEWRGLP